MKRLIVTLILHSSLFTLHSQTWDTLCIDHYRIDTNEVGTLKAEANALAFFQNNEFSSKIQKGYTLPGAWLQPRLTYTPIPQIHVEAGAHLLLFDGANRYPNYAYHDIVRWKGNQHTHGVHALPYLRAQADFTRHSGMSDERHLTLVLGDIYGAQTHQLITPLFNPEQNLSADPEMGFQLLADRRHLHLDTWLNWQSYIFNLDTHQEAFTVGANATLKWRREGKPLEWELPIQLLLQHRGGELDVTDMGVQTVCNAAIGSRITYHPQTQGALSLLRAQVNALASYQQHGTLWPFDTGFAIHTSVQTLLWQHLGVELGYVGIPSQYANLYGSPFFGTLSIRHSGMTFNGMHTTYANVSYTHTFTPAYRLGAQLDVYDANSGSTSAFAFGFGIYLRVCPSFLITGRKKGT